MFLRRWMETARRRVGGVVIDNAYSGLAAVAGLHPLAKPERHGVDVVRNVTYRETGEAAHTLDIYRPAGREGPLPAVVYLHGGSFRILSKDTHWVMALAFARRGFVVFNVNYRLAPDHPYPAAVEDAADAFTWVVEHAEEYGVDPACVVLAGESAGANLATGLAVMTCFERPEPYAQRVWETGVVPKAVLPACGILQVSNWERFDISGPLASISQDRIRDVTKSYYESSPVKDATGLELADPLVFLEGDAEASRPLPPFFAFVGTADPLQTDTERLGAALGARGVRCDTRTYENEGHAFHAFVWRHNAKQAWTDTYAFLDDVLDGECKPVPVETPADGEK